MRMMGYERPSLEPETEVAMKTTAPVSGEPASMEQPAPVPEAEQPVPPSSEEEQPSTVPAVQRRISGKQRRLSLEEYRSTFMRPYRIEDRKPVFISRKLRDTLDRFACKIGENRMSLSGLLENIVRHHVELYAEDFEYWKGMSSLNPIQLRCIPAGFRSGQLKKETFGFGASKFMFRSYRNRLPPHPRSKGKGIPSVCNVHRV